MYYQTSISRTSISRNIKNTKSRFLRSSCSFIANNWSISNAIAIESATGPLNHLFDRSMLLLADIENLSFSAKNNFRLQVAYHHLARLLRYVVRSCELHAFFSMVPGCESWNEQFQSSGWITHPIAVKTKNSYRGQIKRANSDNAILYHAGDLISRNDPELVLIGSGDGDLVCDLAEFIHSKSPQRQVMTLSLPGSTSYRLNAQTNPDIAANLELGRDCLHNSIHHALVGEGRKSDYVIFGF